METAPSLRNAVSREAVDALAGTVTPDWSRPGTRESWFRSAQDHDSRPTTQERDVLSVDAYERRRGDSSNRRNRRKQNVSMSSRALADEGRSEDIIVNVGRNAIHFIAKQDSRYVQRSKKGMTVHLVAKFQ